MCQGGHPLLVSLKYKTRNTEISLLFTSWSKKGPPSRCSFFRARKANHSFTPLPFLHSGFTTKKEQVARSSCFLFLKGALFNHIQSEYSKPLTITLAVHNRSWLNSHKHLPDSLHVCPALQTTIWRFYRNLFGCLSFSRDANHTKIEPRLNLRFGGLVSGTYKI